MEYKITIDLQKTKNIKAINIGAGNMKKRVSLVIVFNNNDDYSKRASYGFKYFKKQWIKCEVGAYYLMGRFEEVQFGKIKK